MDSDLFNLIAATEGHKENFGDCICGWKQPTDRLPPIGGPIELWRDHVIERVAVSNFVARKLHERQTARGR